MSSTTLRDFTRRKTLKIIVARHFSSTLLRLNEAKTIDNHFGDVPDSFKELKERSCAKRGITTIKPSRRRTEGESRGILL